MSSETVLEEKPKQQNKYVLILALLFAVYLMNIATKNLYSAEIVEIIKHFGNATKAQTSLATTFYFATYAFTQFVSVKFIKKVDLIKLFFVTSLASIFMTALIPVCTYLWQVYILFAVNGVLQAFTWPTVMYITSNYLTEKYMPSATVVYGVAYSAGFVLDYGMASVFIKHFNWKIGFWTFCILYLISLLAICYLVSKSQKTEETKGKMVIKTSHETVSKVKSNLGLFYFIVCGSNFLVSVIYYGILNWVTALFHDVFNMSSANSALISTLIPIFGVVAPFFASALSEKFNYWKVTLVTVLIVGSFSLALGFIYSKNVVLTLSVIVFLILTLRCVSNIVSTIIILKGRKFIDTASMAALTNTFSSVGASLGPILVGFIADRSNWGLSFVSIAFLSAVLALLIIIPFKKLSEFT